MNSKIPFKPRVKWHKPKLIVGTRSSNNENVLEACKGWFTMYMPQGSANGCGQRDARWACYWCNAILNS